MDPSIIIGLDIGLVLTIVYVLDRNVFYAVFLILSGLPTWIELRIRQTILGLQLRVDRLGMRSGILGRLSKEIQLRQIRNNPAYREFFDKVQPDPLPERED